MAETFFKGVTQILFIVIDNVDYPIACLTENSLSETSEMIDTTTQDNEGWKTSRPTNQSYNISFSGLQVWSDVENTTRFSYDYLIKLKRNRELLDWKIRTNNGEIEQRGSGYINELSEASPVGDYITFEGNIIGYGKPETEFSYNFEDDDNFIFQDDKNFIFN